jgi:hypothetical protein
MTHHLCFNSRLMKFLKNILASIAFMMLMVPCAHADGHHHHEVDGPEGFCSPICRGCSHEDSCSEMPVVLEPSFSFSDLPIPLLLVICELKPEPIVYAEIIPPPGGLSHLRTVQLLI